MKHVAPHPDLVTDSPRGSRIHLRLRFAAVFSSVLAGLGLSAADVEPSAPPLTFESDIRPILKASCFPCHGEGEKLKGNVDLRLRRFMLTNSESGSVLVPGNPAESVLHRVIRSGDMPKSEKKLTPAQVSTIERWIRAGAPTARPEPQTVPRFFITEEERNFWSFRPIARPSLPAVRDPAALRSPIDRFLLAALDQKELSFAAEASRAVLLRRLSFDLTGLPPTPEELSEFAADTSPGAYERQVDRLLDSPRFGERWGRHWLDVAGYADSNGGPESDSDRPWAWRYRDYVIRSLNADKPFDQFITEQLAGDELVSPPYERLEGPDMDRLVATGFLRLAPDPTGDGPADPALAQNQVIADTLQIVSTSLLGLTVQCAQCHDHRYDPIPQTDYYRLRAIFEPAFDWKHWRGPEARNVSLLVDDTRKRAEAIEADAAKIDQEAQKLHDELIEAFVQRQLKLVPEALREPVLNARRTPKDKRTETQHALLREYVTFQDGIILGEIDKDGAKRVEDVRKRATELRATKPPDERVHCLIEQPGAIAGAETFLFHRGDHQQPKERIAPGGLSVLESVLPQDIASTNASVRTSGRRLAFARQLTDRRHPLVARVLVNRFWHHTFGAGLVPSLADFGMLGERPSNPALLDWLADDFMAGGWRLKPFLRTLLTSAAYRQGPANPRAADADPDNRMFARRTLRRLDAEGVRDALLSVSGRSSANMFGRPIPVAYSAVGQVVVGLQNRDGNGDPTAASPLGSDEFRRSVYVTFKRTAPVGVLETFDAPLANPNCEARASSTVALQSLLFLNDDFVIARANDLAERVRREVPDDESARLRRLWLLVFGVEPTRLELERSHTFLAAQAATFERASTKPADAAAKPSSATPAAGRSPDQLALASLCQALLGSNRFLYVE